LVRCIGYGNHKISGRDRKVNELYEEEKGHLLSLPDTVFTNVKVCCGRADKYATVIVDKNRYSVPTGYAGFSIKVLLYVDRVELFLGTKKLATHDRLYGNNKWSLNPDHYLELIQRRPLSFNSARPIRQWRQSWPKSLETLLERFCQSQGNTKGIKDFITVLMLYRDYDASDVEAAVDLAIEHHISASDGVHQILVYNNSAEGTIPPLTGWSSLPAPDISVYGQLGGVR